MAGAEQESSHTAKCAAAENPDALRSVSKSNWALALLFARLKTERTSSSADVFKREMLLKAAGAVVLIGLLEYWVSWRIAGWP